MNDISEITELVRQIRDDIADIRADVSEMKERLMPVTYCLHCQASTTVAAAPGQSGTFIITG